MRTYQIKDKQVFQTNTDSYGIGAKHKFSMIRRTDNMKKVILYINATIDDDVNEKVEEMLKEYSKAHGYEVIAALGEDSHGTGMSLPMKFAMIGAGYEEGVEAVVTMMSAMIGSDEEDIRDTLITLGKHNIEVETITDDLEDYYKEIYGVNHACEECDQKETCNLIQTILHLYEAEQE